MDTVDVVFVDLRLDLIVAQVVDDTDFLSGRDVLSKFDIQQPDLALDRRAHLKAGFPLAYKHHIALHGLQVVGHLIHLRAPQLGIFLQPLLYEDVLLHSQLIVFLGLQILLPAVELLALQRFLMAEAALLGLNIHLQLGRLVAVVELILLHGDLRIAQHVLLLGQFAFGIEYL